MIELGKDDWTPLYEQVLVIALRLTRTKDASQQSTQVDHVREATQRAFERCLRARPANLNTIDALRTYLVWAVRSELQHASREAAARRKHESQAAVEAATVAGTTVASVEVTHLEGLASNHGRERAVRALKQLREALAGDPIALGTIECIERGILQPSEQGRALRCSVELVYAARKRRKRTLKHILAALDAEDRKENA